MKKAMIIALGLLLVPFTAMGMQSMDEAQMDKITGQSGVSIAVDDVKIYQNTKGQWYEDTDGYTRVNSDLTKDNVGGSASVGYQEIDSLTHINALLIGDDGSGNTVLTSPGRDLQGNYPGMDASDYVAPSALTIDVTDKLPVLTQAANIILNKAGGTGTGNGVAGVRIGLPTVEVYTSSSTVDVAVNVADNPLNAGSSQKFSYGKIHTGPDTMAILDGHVEIAPNSAKEYYLTGSK